MQKTLMALFLLMLSILLSLSAKADRISEMNRIVLNQDRCLNLYRPSTNERAFFCYWKKEQGFQKNGYLDAVTILRDAEYKTKHYIDPRLLDVLFIIQTWLKQEGRRSDIHILSGYRTPTHNFRLEGAAKQSLHMKGMAADIYIPNLDTKVLAVMSRYVGAGGVGIYLDRNFIHIDTGAIRTWRGN